MNEEGNAIEKFAASCTTKLGGLELCCAFTCAAKFQPS